MKNVNKLILSGISTLTILAVLMAVLSNVHLDHIDTGVEATLSSMAVGALLYWFLSLERSGHLIRKLLGTDWNWAFNTLE